MLALLFVHSELILNKPGAYKYFYHQKLALLTSLNFLHDLLKQSFTLFLPCLAQDVGQSILESYSRVLESLAFNTIARIDDVIYVDDATKKSAAAETVSIFNRGTGAPVQKKISPSPFSIQHTPYASPFATPTFCSSTPVNGNSPGRAPEPPPSKKNPPAKPEIKVEKLFSGDVEKVWTYAGNLSARKEAGDAPERD